MEWSLIPSQHSSDSHLGRSPPYSCFFWVRPRTAHVSGSQGQEVTSKSGKAIPYLVACRPPITNKGAGSSAGLLACFSTTIHMHSLMLKALGTCGYRVPEMLLIQMEM